MSTPDILKKIVAVKRDEVAVAQGACSLAAMRAAAEAAVRDNPARDFAGAIVSHVAAGQSAVIA